MSRRAEGRRAGRGLVRAGRRGHAVSRRSLVEVMEGRVLLSVSAQADTPFRIVAITGNQQSDLSARYPDETLFDVKVGTPGSDPAFLDGFTVPAGAKTTLTTVGEVPGAVPGLSDGITQGTGALRVDAPQDGSTFWGLRSPNIVDLLAFGADTVSYDLTLIGKELNGGSYAGADTSFTGYAQSNEMAINLSDGTWIQKRLDLVGDDSTGLAGQWSGADRTHRISWDLNQYTTPDGSSLKDYLAAHPDVNGAWFVLPIQGTEIGSPNANGTQGPMRFYFDNFQLSNSSVHSLVGDFDPVATTKLVTLPFVPDTDAIGYDPENGLLYRTSGASSYRDDPTRIGYNDNQFMESVDLNSPAFTQAGIFNSNYEGDGTTGPYGLPAPRPTFVLPAERRTPDQTDPAIGNLVGEGEYDAARDLAWSPTEHLFYVAAHTGIYKLTPAGVSTKATSSTYGGEPKGITFATIDGQRRLLVAQRNVGAISVIDTADMSELGRITLTKPVTGDLVPGLVALEEGPDGLLYGVANKPDLPFQRDLVRIDPTTGETTTIGTLGLHVADIAIVAAAPSGAADAYVRGDAWTTSFKQYLENKGMGDDAFGYKLVGNGAAVGGPPANPDQVLPWINVNQVVLKYATAPTGGGVPTPGNLTISSARGVSYTITGVTPVAGDPTAFVVAFNQPLGGGNPATGVAPTAQQNGDRITLTVPSAGPGGAALTVRMNVLQGDVDHTGETGGTHQVLANDFSAVKKKFFKNTSDAATGADTDYSAFHDVNGSGDILANDFSEVKKRFFQELAPPPAASEALAGASITSDLFGGKRIL